MEVQGYPQFVIPVVLGVGIFLAVVRPYTAFLFALVLLTAGDATKLNQTRVSALGPYFNLSDACMLVALTGFFFDRVAGKRPIRTPQIVFLMCFVLIIATVQSFWRFGWTYETMRAFRWAIDMPVALFLGANLVTSVDRTRGLIRSLLIGALLAAIQHLLLVADIWRTQSLDMRTFHVMRTIVYWAGCMPAAFILTAAIWQMPAGHVKKGLFTLAGLLFFGTVFMNQTRSLWISMAATVPCLLCVFKSSRRVFRAARFVLLIAVVLVATGLIAGRIMPGLDVFKLAGKRLVDLSSEKTQSGTRQRAFQAEMREWSDGTLVFGRGLYFYQVLPFFPDNPARKIAFGHLGYVTYLSQMGLLGVFVYGLCLPFGAVRDARWLWNCGVSADERYLGLLGGASIICFSIMFVMGAGFLGLGHFAPGVLYGGMWSQVRMRHVVASADHYSLTES
jgi:hypothetical protein